jgi:hypothetical protein
VVVLVAVVRGFAGDVGCGTEGFALISDTLKVTMCVTITRRKTLDSAVMTTRAEMYH